METLIVICLFAIIILLLQEKIVLKRPSNEERFENHKPSKINIMGVPKLSKSHLKPSEDTKSQLSKPIPDTGNFDQEIERKTFDLQIPQEEPGEVSDGNLDLEREEEEWHREREPEDEDGFATGVTLEELSTVGMLLQQEKLEPSLIKQTVSIVHKIQGTELLGLLENSMEGASKKIANLLEKSLRLAETDPGSSSLRKNTLEDFDVNDFV